MDPNLSGVGEAVANAVRDNLKTSGTDICSDKTADNMSKAICDKILPIIDKYARGTMNDQITKAAHEQVAAAIQAQAATLVPKMKQLLTPTLDAQIHEAISQQEVAAASKLHKDIAAKEMQIHFAKLDRNSRQVPIVLRASERTTARAATGADGEIEEIREKLAALEVAQKKAQEEDIIANYREILRLRRDSVFPLELVTEVDTTHGNYYLARLRAVEDGHPILAHSVEYKWEDGKNKPATLAQVAQLRSAAVAKLSAGVKKMLQEVREAHSQSILRSECLCPNCEPIPPRV